MPRHRWFFFPHSFAPRLIHEILDHWNLPQRARLLDPFVGAGTTVVVARQRAMQSCGWDILPLAVLVSRAKTRAYKVAEVECALSDILVRVRRESPDLRDAKTSNARLVRAFSPSELSELLTLRDAIERQRPRVRELLLLALLGTAREFSRGVSDGGWMRWVDKKDGGARVLSVFQDRVQQIQQDLAEESCGTNSPTADVFLWDARSPRPHGMEVDAIVTSPPYPNRHDYSRVFHIDLLLMRQTEAQIKELRHSALRSHVEARIPNEIRIETPEFQFPAPLRHALQSLPRDGDQRIRSMLEGYTLDLFATLYNCFRSLKQGGKAAFVVGNVRHAGTMIPVDEILTELALGIGFSHSGTWVVRLRGNSAQQMGKFGRVPSRESVILLAKGDRP